MSFSRKVKEELSLQNVSARHCMIAEIAAIVSICGRILINSSDKYSVKIVTENIDVARKYFTLIRKAFNIKAEITIRQNANLKKSRYYTITVNNSEDAVRILQATKLMDEFNEIRENLSIVNNVVIMNSCCKRAYLRGAFLASGSISTPEKSYHFELVCDSKEKAWQLCNIIKSFEIDAKVVERKNRFVVYIKEGESIVDMLNIMEAHVSLMELENVRILKDMRNKVNRKVNCETANINKTVAASVKQVEDILIIRDTLGLDGLQEQLRDMAIVRLENPDASLKELGILLSPTVGKSGVNHRLRKLSEIAEGLKTKKEE
jgi:DNA-binding protein WhiA